MKPSLQSVSRRVDGVEVKLEEHTGRLKALDAKIDTVDAIIDDRFDTLRRHIDLKTESIVSEFRAFRDELRGHSGRIDRLEVVADSHSFRLENLEKKRRPGAG